MEHGQIQNDSVCKKIMEFLNKSWIDRLSR